MNYDEMDGTDLVELFQETDPEGFKAWAKEQDERLAVEHPHLFPAQGD